jgi:hypothetical protein
VFLATLRFLRPALAVNSQVEGLNQIWFNGERATAFNDIIGIEVPVPDCDFAGGVNGAALLGMLEASTAKEVEVGVSTKDGESLTLKAPGLKAELPIVPADRALFTFPQTVPTGFAIDNDLFDAFKHVGIALSSAGENMGVTLAPEDDVLALYASDGATIAWARVQKPKKGYKAKRIVLSPAFCEQLAALNAGGMTLSIIEHKGLDDDDRSMTYSEAIACDNQSGARLFGRLVEAKELDFASVIEANVGNAKKAVTVPEKLTGALARAEVLVNGVQRKPLEVATKDGVLRLHLKSDLGELSEAIKLDGKPANVDGLFNTAHLQRGVGRAERMIVGAECFAFLGKGDSGYLVAVWVGA